MHKMYPRSRLFAATSLVLLSLSGSASAELIREVALSSGMNAGSLTLPMGTGNYFSGLQVLQVDAERVLAYCIDPYQLAPTSNHLYTRRNDFNAYFGGRAAAIDTLYSNFYAATLPGAVNANVNAAGFQLALWELVADNSVLGTGIVRTNSSTNAGVRNSAQGLLSALPAASLHGLYNYTIYTNASKQDYLVVTPRPRNQVPEPASLWLMLAAGAAALGLRRLV